MVIMACPTDARAQSDGLLLGAHPTGLAYRQTTARLQMAWGSPASHDDRGLGEHYHRMVLSRLLRVLSPYLGVERPPSRGYHWRVAGWASLSNDAKRFRIHCGKNTSPMGNSSVHEHRYWVGHWIEHWTGP